MIHHADERIVDLKSRVYKNAGLYVPPGVGGTHVMYVLQHADQPQLYHDLPKDPQISLLLELWIGVLKPIMSLRLVLVALTGFLYYVTAGPKGSDEG